VGGFFAATKYRPQFDAMAAQILLADDAKSVERRIIYYRNPMGEPDISAVPKKDSMGMDYIPVYENEIPAGEEKKSELAPASGEKKVLYYRNPMGLPDKSPVPKKDSMGMDYIAVYEDEAAGDPSIVRVSVEKVQRAGVKTEVVEKRVLSQPVLAPGSIKLDETRQLSITLRAEGFIEKVYAGATGQHVKAGEPLFRFYSPEITQAAVEYRLAAANGLKEAGSRKLRNLGVPETFIKSIPAKGDIPLSMDWPSPVDGVLMTKNAIVGGRVMPGDELYRLADVNTVWVIADVAELDIGHIKIGDPAAIKMRSFPGEIFNGKVAFILPELKLETRTAQVRIELPNPDHKLLHGMYADVEIETGEDASVLAIPTTSIIDSGKRQVAIVEVGEGKFKPTEVQLGRRGEKYVEVLSGLTEGEKVVTRANFLIDAESNLQAALTSLASADGAAQ
jgi:membrane fusion protein, copper/silver efflux system